MTRGWAFRVIACPDFRGVLSTSWSVGCEACQSHSHITISFPGWAIPSQIMRQYKFFLLQVGSVKHFVIAKREVTNTVIILNANPFPASVIKASR